MGHVGKVLSDLSPGTWGQMMWKAQAAESLTLRSSGLHLDESEKEHQKTDSWFALALAA